MVLRVHLSPLSGIPQIAADFSLILSLTGIPGKREWLRHLVDGRRGVHKWRAKPVAIGLAPSAPISSAGAIRGAIPVRAAMAKTGCETIRLEDFWRVTGPACRWPRAHDGTRRSITANVNGVRREFAVGGHLVDGLRQILRPACRRSCRRGGPSWWPGPSPCRSRAPDEFDPS